MPNIEIARTAEGARRHSEFVERRVRQALERNRRQRSRKYETISRPLRLEDVPPGSKMAPETLEAIAAGDYEMSLSIRRSTPPPVRKKNAKPVKQAPSDRRRRLRRAQEKAELLQIVMGVD